ncbi:universal stress protein [Streptomyces albidochromogenes]|uniref:Universal stress protein n=1 Tax=Streptomyces albidochromogenes TaxID=329524 RepID=A0ABW6FPX1_9ACTN
MVTREEPACAGPIVLAVGGSSAGEKAVDFAFAEAALRGAEIVAVHTWLPVSQALLQHAHCPGHRRTGQRVTGRPVHRHVRPLEACTDGRHGRPGGGCPPG